MDSVSGVSGGLAFGGSQVQPPKADMQQVSEFERLMSGDMGINGFDRYANGSDSPAQWLSETLVKAGKEVSATYREGMQNASIKFEELDPADPMMLPKLTDVQTQVHNAVFQLQFTTALAHLANNGVKTLFNLQG